MKNFNNMVLRGKINVVAQSMAQSVFVRFVILYPLRNENEHFIIFRFISIINSRDQKEHFTIAFIIEFAIFKTGVLFGTHSI